MAASVLKFIHSTAKRLPSVGCAELFYLLAIPLMACGGDTPPTESPNLVSTGTAASAFTSVSARGYHTCGVRPDCPVECWGSNVDSDGNEVDKATPDGSFISVSAGGSIPAA